MGRVAAPAVTLRGPGGVTMSAPATGAVLERTGLKAHPVLSVDVADVVSATTLTNAMAARLYADALTTPTADALMLLIDFITNFSTVNGTFGIQFAATGVATVDWTP